jgi:hypothetical protein
VVHGESGLGRDSPNGVNVCSEAKQILSMTFHRASASQSSLKKPDLDQSLHLNWLEEKGVASETQDDAVGQPRRAMNASIMYQKISKETFHLSVLLDDFLGQRTAKTVKQRPKAQADPGKATYRPARGGVGVSLEVCIDDGCDMVGWYVATERFFATGAQTPVTSRLSRHGGNVLRNTGRAQEQASLITLP